MRPTARAGTAGRTLFVVAIALATALASACADPTTAPHAGREPSATELRLPRTEDETGALDTAASPPDSGAMAALAGRSRPLAAPAPARP